MANQPTATSVLMGRRITVPNQLSIRTVSNRTYHINHTITDIIIAVLHRFKSVITAIILYYLQRPQHRSVSSEIENIFSNNEYICLQNVIHKFISKFLCLCY